MGYLKYNGLFKLPLGECLSVKPEQVDPQPLEASVAQIPRLSHCLNNDRIVVVAQIVTIPSLLVPHMLWNDIPYHWYDPIVRWV